MREVLLKDYIRQKRLDAGLTQAQLCEGICDTVTLSRLENGQQTPSRNTITALLQRLGLPHDRYFALLSDREMEVKSLQDEISAEVIEFRRAAKEDRPTIRAKALENVEKLTALAGEEDKFIQQYLLSIKVSLGTPDGPYSYEEKVEMLMEAICLTVPRFELDKIGEFLYTLEESRLINQLANVYSSVGELKRAANIYSQLLKYVEKHDEGIMDYAKHFCLIAMNYAIDLDTAKHYDEAIELANRGREICAKYGNYQLLGSFIAIMAECYFYKQDFAKSVMLYIEACAIYAAVDDKSNLANMRNEMQEHLGLKPPF